MNDPSKKEPLKKLTQEELDNMRGEYKKWRNTSPRTEEKFSFRRYDFRGLKFTPSKNPPYIDLRQMDFSGSNLSGVDLTKADLIGSNLTETKLEESILTEAELGMADLTRADFSNATLTNAKFCKFSHIPTDTIEGGATLIETKFLNAKMHGADLRKTLTAGMQLGGADVTNAQLPDEIKSFEGLKTVEEASKITKRLFTILLTALGFSMLTILSTKDVQLLTNSATSPLPIIQTPMPLASFYQIAPILLTAFFIYFLLNLLHLHKLISRLPAVFPDGIPMDEKIFPWLLNTLVHEFFSILNAKKIPFFCWRKILIVFLAWWSTPLILVCYWFRYLRRHDFFGSLFHIVWVTLIIFLAIATYHKTIQTLKNDTNHRRLLKYFCQFFGGILCVVLFYITAMIQFDNFSVSNRWPYPSKNWLIADFSEQAVSQKPDNWSEKKPTDGVKGAKLEGVNLDYVNGYYAFLVKANLSKASLKGANLFGANLTKAVIYDSDLTGAELLYADLSEASLADTNLDGVRFDEANIYATYLVRARNLTPEQIKKAKHWQLALYDRDFKENKLHLTDDEIEKATRVYLKQGFFRVLCENLLKRRQVSQASGI